jgi:hypothetical protein
MSECDICCEIIDNENKLKCGHIFHKKCIDEWIHHSNTCPLCRREIKSCDEIDEILNDEDEKVAEMDKKSNFAFKPVKLNNNEIDFGKTVTITIPRYGDIMEDIKPIKLPPIKFKQDISKNKWVKKIGHNLINSVNVEIGGQQIDKQYGEWLNIWNELNDKKENASINNKPRHNKKMFYNH